MPRTNLTIFDFDGTLYPIEEYDSEQLLIREGAKHRGALFKKRCKHFIEQDQKGVFNDTTFHQRYEKLVRHTTGEMIDAVAENLSARTGEPEREAILQLAKVSDLGILTCGTENLAHAFLEKLGLEKHFSFIRGKYLDRDPEGVQHLIVDIAGPQGKAEALEGLREKYETIIAIGDGPTDIPMLQIADLGLIVSWNSSKRTYPFETHEDLASAVRRSISYLQSKA
ncbi:MAG: HAD family hydrolase [Sphaerochaeta sp.]